MHALREHGGQVPAGQTQMIHRNALRLQKLVNALLDFSRIEAGRMQASYEPTALARTTAELASLVARVVKTREAGQNPATRTFQALRIFINAELQELEQALAASLQVLQPGGWLVVISFHSLEDRIVKQFMKQHSQQAPLPKWAAVREADLPQPPLALIGKAVKPSENEVQMNPRARSAVLRVAERTEGKFEG